LLFLGCNFEEAGKWIISCRYTETRQAILQISTNKVLTTSCELDIKPGNYYLRM